MYADDKEQLLRGSEDSSSVDAGETERNLQYRRAEGRRGRYLTLALSSCLIVSIILHAVVFFRSWRQARAGTQVDGGRVWTTFSGLEYDVPATYTYHTEFWNETGILSDERWEAINIDPAMIAVTPEWAAEKGLPPSQKFPWDTTKQLYFVKVFHQLHCLKSIRQAFRAFEHGYESPVPFTHVSHCLDALRQDITCHADDTPMPSPRLYHSFGDGQPRQCMDFDKLVEWTQHPDRNACHRHLKEYEPIHHSIERYAFCPPESPYYEKMNAYFEKHGHKDPSGP